MKKLISFLFLTLVLVSCGGGYDTDGKVKAVFAVHDEVMPKMGEMMKLKKQLLDKTADLTDSTEIIQLRALAKDLDEAQSGMMVWMREWSKTAQPHIEEKTSEEDRDAFFTAEMEKVEKVKTDINASIAAAEEVLK